MPAADLRALLAELAGWAAARGHAPTLHRYGDGPDHEADLLLPPGDGPYRLAVLLHGGFWRAPFKREIMAALAVDLAARGWATWNVEYRRVGAGGGVPQTIEDVRAALDALPQGFERVVVIGHSAGGQLALCVAGVPQIVAVVSLAGVCDLETGARERIGEGAVLEFLGGTPEELPVQYAIADPMALLPADAEVLLVHGDADDRVPVQQSRDYLRAARSAGGRCELLELAGVDHFALIDPRSSAWSTAAERLERLLPTT
ncbi:MAG: alpha/beta hydrolase family protein [Solirubrobacteraceae bacterium]